MDKWLAGILATVISGVAVYYLTEGRHNDSVVVEPIESFPSEPVEPEPVEPEPADPEPAPPESSQLPENLTSFDPENATEPPVAPDSTCAVVPGMFWLGQPNIWYGPFFGYAIAWNGPGGFYVGHQSSGQPAFYPDLYASGQAQRNVWLRLPNSPFNICVDSLAGNVFGQYSPI